MQGKPKQGEGGWEEAHLRKHCSVRAYAQAAVYLDEHPIPVRVVPVTDEATRAQVSEVYRRQYLDDPFLPSILRDEVVPMTLRLEPQEDPAMEMNSFPERSSGKV